MTCSFPIIILLLSIFNVLHVTVQQTNVDSSTYLAAVVEYYPLQGINLSPDERTIGNTRNYLSLLNEISGNLDIIVFPEATVTTGFRGNNRTHLLAHATYVPDPVDNVIVCNQRNESFLQFFIDLSCGARNRSTYMVVNILEKYNCTRDNCANDGFDVYNSNVVFDRNGAVVSRYRKYNLFGEYGINRTTTPELATFITDFNVTFGQFICFDLLFDEPANALVRAGVRNFVFPTMWFSELPFLTAFQAQKQWAYENDVNFLSAGANNPRVGSGGSAIFEGKRGALYEEIVALGGSRVLIANVTKNVARIANEIITVDEDLTTDEIDQESSNLDGFYLLKDDLTNYNYHMINLTSNNVTEETLCDHDGNNNVLCCDFYVRIRLNDTVLSNGDNNNYYYYNYALVVFNGVRSFSGTYNGGIETCGVVACSSDHFDSCGVRFSNYSRIVWPVTFENITIQANYSNALYKTRYPNSVRSNLRPLPVSKIYWNYDKVPQNNSVITIYRLVEPETRLLSFSIFGRDYSRDSDPRGTSSSTILRGSLIYLLLVVYILSLYK